MKNIVLVTLISVSSVASADSSMPALAYKSVQCQLSKNEELVESFQKDLMTLQIDESFGRFIQVQLQESETTLQYQLLIEDDAKKDGSVIVLQNFKVGEIESSAEFSTPELSFVRIRQGDFSLRCEVSK